MVHVNRGRRDEAGAVAVLVALASLVLFTVSGLVIDMGQTRVTRQHAQNAADAAALAAGNALYLAGTETPDVAAAVAAARSNAAANYGTTDSDWAGCTDPSPLPYQPDGATSCISLDSPTAPLQVRVVMPRREVSTPFGAMLGVASVAVAATSQTTLTPGGASDCGLCVTGEGDHDVQNGEVTISGGDIALNGDVLVGPNGLVASGAGSTIAVEGTASGPSDGYSPSPLQHQQPIADPLATIPMPDDTTLTAKSDPCGTGSSHGPGVYGAWNFPNGTCTLQPGTYAVTGKWALAGSTALDGSSGVTLDFVCGTTTAPRACNAPGEPGGWLDGSGGGSIRISAPTSGPTKGLAIVYDRLNTSDLTLTGNGASSYVGTIYANSARMLFDGNGCAGTNQALIIVADLELNGTNSCLGSDYQQNVNVYVPPAALHLSK